MNIKMRKYLGNLNVNTAVSKPIVTPKKYGIHFISALKNWNQLLLKQSINPMKPNRTKAIIAVSFRSLLEYSEFFFLSNFITSNIPYNSDLKYNNIYQASHDK